MEVAMRPSRGLAPALAAVILAACGGGAGGPNPYETERNVFLTVLRAMVIEGGDLGLAENGTLTPYALLEQRACVVSGTVSIHDDGRRVFDRCVLTEGEELNGTIRKTDDNFTFEGFNGTANGHPFSVEGGYFGTDVGDSRQITVNMTGTHPWVDDETVMFEASGSITYSRTSDTASGWIRYVVVRDGEPSAFQCEFDAASLESLVSLEDGSDFARSLCPDPEQFDATFVLYNADSQNIHIKRPGEDFHTGNRVTPGASQTRAIEIHQGDSVAWEAGRNGTVLDMVVCAAPEPAQTRTVTWGAGQLVCE
jgi:hypothetical protein